MQILLARWFICGLLVLDILSAATSGLAADLVVDMGTRTVLSSEELLRRPDAVTIQVPADVSYGRTMTYRAVPLRALLGAGGLPADQDVQITATDGFVTDLPTSLIHAPGDGGAVPWLAIEPADSPWPPTPGGKATGPFYLVWLDPSASGVTSEQWPFAVETLRFVPTWASKWPALAVGNDVPAASPIRTGEAVFARQCMVCHQLGGSGDAKVGPDLNSPRNPTEYFQPWALRAYIRAPASLRTWPDMKMTGFDRQALSDTDLDAIIAYLTYKAAQHPPQ
ncbi:c-type cytochrome [Labrys okinawensis]|uniref:c-type cytochrome n=1 Tax=Labrys okinawensis TaxID=346911 RepID=UPI0039BD0774